MDKIDTLRQAWASGDRQAAAHAVEVAECPPPPATFSVSPCLDAAARAFGSTAFSTEKPDQASAAAVAYVLARRRTGEGLPSPDTWLEAAANAKGAGADALRLALAFGLAEAAPNVGKHVNNEPAARAMMSSVASAVPGACDAYGALGRGAAVASFAAAASPDHSPCVQHDLQRKDALGAAYGEGLWRATAGSAALWKDAARALAAGIALTDGSVERTIRTKLDVIEAADRDLDLHRVTTTQTGQYQAADAHRAEGVLPEGGASAAPSASAVGAKPEARRALP
jgi:hypothetical protein